MHEIEEVSLDIILLDIIPPPRKVTVPLNFHNLYKLKPLKVMTSIKHPQSEEIENISQHNKLPNVTSYPNHYNNEMKHIREKVHSSSGRYLGLEKFYSTTKYLIVTSVY